MSPREDLYSTVRQVDRQLARIFPQLNINVSYVTMPRQKSRCVSIGTWNLLAGNLFVKINGPVIVKRARLRAHAVSGSAVY